MKYQLSEYNTEVIEFTLDQAVKQVPSNSFWVIDDKVASLYPAFNNLPDHTLLVNAEEANKNIEISSMLPQIDADLSGSRKKSFVKSRCTSDSNSTF